MTTGSNVDATVENDEPLLFDEAEATVWWSWQAPASGWIEIDTFGSEIDTVLVVYEGTALPALAELESNDDSGDDYQSRVRFEAVSGTQYQIQVAGYEGETGAISLEVKGSSAPTPPVLNSITVNPTNLDITGGVAASTDITIDISAPDGIEQIEIELYDDDGSPAGGLFLDDLTQTSGDNTGGTFTGTLSLTPYRNGGTWPVVLTIVEDNGDETIYGSGADPYPAPFGGTLSVTNTGTVDMALPEVTLLTFTPQTVDVTSAGQEVTVRVEASDDIGGPFDAVGYLR